ncbi:Peptidyl-tRNA hydrolase, mitochondrial [Vitis vinifera]|uniref:Peptidyl-tRNA hydrolase, mitochondrial n=1 Tax=Vitis vinifera TaxID=29760 RepID=A0A438FIX7_VITVI|nr:Peptidyl-tRNA hydrolase, mitochondrial [Vitis vinifera]
MQVGFEMINHKGFQWTQFITKQSLDKADPLVAYYKLSLNRVVVFHGDMSLPCGVLRLHHKEGHGSHNEHVAFSDVNGGRHLPRAHSHHHLHVGTLTTLNQSGWGSCVLSPRIPSSSLIVPYCLPQRPRVTSPPISMATRHITVDSNAPLRGLTLRRITKPSHANEQDRLLPLLFNPNQKARLLCLIWELNQWPHIDVTAGCPRPVHPVASAARAGTCECAWAADLEGG